MGKTTRTADESVLAESLHITNEPAKPQEASLKTSDWPKLCMWLDWQIAVLKAKSGAYKAAQKKYKTSAFDGQLSYWKNQISTYESLKANILQANGG